MGQNDEGGEKVATLDWVARKGFLLREGYVSSES